MKSMQYAEMKDSGFQDIGKYPAYWLLLRIKHRYTIVSGATPTDNPKNWDGEIAWIGPADMQDFGKIQEGKRYISQIGYNSCGTTLVPAETVILSTRAPIGKIQISVGNLCTNQGCKALIKKSQSDSPYYLAYYLFAIKESLQVAGTGTTFKELSTTNLANMPLLIPPIEDQLSIVSYLDARCSAIDAIIAQAKETIEEYKSWKASVIFEAVTKGLDPNVEMKDSGVEWIGKIPMAWESTRLKVQVRQKTIVTQETTGYIGLENVKSGSGVLVPCSDENFEAEGQALVIHPGDVIFGKLRPYLAKCYLVKESGCCSSEFLVLTPKSINGEFLKYVMLSPKFINEINMATYGTKMPRANWYSVGGTHIPVPREQEQIKIVQFLNAKSAAIDSIISEKQVLIDDLESYKKSLIFETVTGKRRVC